MQSCDTLIRQAHVVDGSGDAGETLDVAIGEGRIIAIAPALDCKAATIIDGEGLTLAPGFIDAHTHDDLRVIHDAAMPAKLSQGVTTVIWATAGSALRR
jgi:N-acyl-D-amino-acid deacylase